jgi:DNA polymerase III epsilon subunit-like protein
MDNLVAIDFETGNYKRVSACALGYARIDNNGIVGSGEYLIRPVGGFTEFHSKIHGIKSRHVQSKPDFAGLYKKTKGLLSGTLIGHSLFDKQVLNALNKHFGLKNRFSYRNTCALAKECLPDLKNHKLKTLARHFDLPGFKHHCPEDDAVTCARIFLKLNKPDSVKEKVTFKQLAADILKDDIVDYKEAYQLLYYFEEHPELMKEYGKFYMDIKGCLADDHLDNIESDRIRNGLTKIINL